VPSSAKKSSSGEIPSAGPVRHLHDTTKPTFEYERHSLPRSEPSPKGNARLPRSACRAFPDRASRPQKNQVQFRAFPAKAQRDNKGGGRGKERDQTSSANRSRLCPSQGGQIFQSQGLVSIDRSMVAALLSTTPRLTPKSSTNDLAPLHCTGIGIASASGRETDRPTPPGAVVAVAFPPRSRRPRISLPPNVEVRTVSSRIWAGF
jgi:hypothetical protein